MLRRSEFTQVALIALLALPLLFGCSNKPKTLSGKYPVTDKIGNEFTEATRTDIVEFTDDMHVKYVVMGKSITKVPGAPDEQQDFRQERTGAYMIEGNKVICMLMFKDGEKDDLRYTFEIRGDELVMQGANGGSTLGSSVFKKIN